jgi:hypothetical protein
LRPNPFHDIFGILKGCWEGIFWGEPILHIDDRVVRVVCDKAAVFIVVSERLQHESTAAKIYQDWTGLLFLGGRFVDVRFDSLTSISKRYRDYLIRLRIEM